MFVIRMFFIRIFSFDDSLMIFVPNHKYLIKSVERGVL